MVVGKSCPKFCDHQRATYRLANKIAVRGVRSMPGKRKPRSLGTSVARYGPV